MEILFTKFIFWKKISQIILVNIMETDNRKTEQKLFQQKNETKRKNLVLDKKLSLINLNHIIG